MRFLPPPNCQRSGKKILEHDHSTGLKTTFLLDEMTCFGLAAVITVHDFISALIVRVTQIKFSSDSHIESGFLKLRRIMTIMPVPLLDFEV